MGRAAEPIDLDAIASPDASPLVRAQLAQIYALLRTLPTDDRIAWTLRAIEGHDLETVARMASCSLATAKRRIGRAQKALDALFVHPDAATPSASPTGSSPGAPLADSDTTAFGEGSPGEELAGEGALRSSHGEGAPATADAAPSNSSVVTPGAIKARTASSAAAVIRPGSTMARSWAGVL